jgi:hypothetical protein
MIVGRDEPKTSSLIFNELKLSVAKLLVRPDLAAHERRLYG